MPRNWMIAVPSLALVIALAGCGDICSDMEPAAEPPPARVGQEQPIPTAPPAPTPAAGAATVSCLVSGFPANGAHLNNVDKACLDDLVQRLKSDPRAHAVVIGHADSHERNADELASRRARVVQGYLVQGGGIDGGLVRVRSAAASRPLDTGTDDSAQAKNRSCEVWFVPEGASEPD